MDDFFDDFDGDGDGSFDDYGDDGGCDDDSDDAETDAGDDEITFEPDDGSGGFSEWQDWMIIGPLSEELARERRERERLMRKIERDGDREC